MSALDFPLMPQRSLVEGKLHSVTIGSGVTFDPNVVWRIRGTGNTLEIRDGAVLKRAKIFVEGRNLHVVIGRNVRLKQGTLSVAGDGSSVSIGDDTTWESGQIIAEDGESITIGRDCMFSHDIMVRTSDGHGIFDATSGEPINTAKPVVVEDHVWIGNGARVNKGAVLGSGMVLAHASVLSGKAEPRTVYAGVPARPLRSNVNWSRTTDYHDIPEEYAVRT
jgi:acetyltransferase-like isoleucine patch superfamily enzyme